MSHQLVHLPGQVISSADFDRIVRLINNRVTQSQAALLDSLINQISAEELSSDLRVLLNTIFSNSVTATNSFVGTGATNTFTLSGIPLVTPTVFLNGILQDGGDFTITGNQIIFVITPRLGDKIIVKFLTGSTVFPVILGGFTLNYSNVLQMVPSTDNFFIYGTNKISTAHEVAQLRALDLLQSSPVINVNSGVPDNELMVNVGGFIWAVGATSGINTITRIDKVALTSTIITITTLTGTVVSLATDGVFVYAFMKGGPNGFAKLDLTGTPVGIISSGLTVTGTVNSTVSNTGFLYGAFGDPTVKQVRKYNTNPANGLLKVHQLLFSPIKIIPVNTDIYVINNVGDGTNINLQKISSIDDSITNLQAYPFVPSNIAFDNFNLWISTADTLNKCDLNGNILLSITPLAGKPIKDIMTAFGFVWVTYTTDTTINISKIFPGLPGN